MRSRRTALFVVACCAAASCIDFGNDIPPPPVVFDATPPPTFDAPPGQPDAPPPPDSAAGCVEEAVAPSDTGPQVRFTTLNVDAPVLAIKAGDVVTWTNTDSMKHTATAGAPGAQLPPELGGFDSGDVFPGAKWAYRFCDPRTVIYFCTTHPEQMNGFRIIVEE